MRLRTVILAGVLGLAVACGGGYKAPSAPSTTNPAPANAPNTIGIPSGAQSRGSSAYAPNPITVSAGTTVTWTNNDTIAHTATSDSTVFDSGTIQPGQSYQFTFANRGTFAYHCALHRGMVGSVIVQ